MQNSGTLVDVLDYEEENEKLIEKRAKEPADGKQVMLGITKASLATNSPSCPQLPLPGDYKGSDQPSWGKIDPLIGLKENVIIGKLIPGTGMKCYSNIKLDTDAAEDEEEFDDELSNWRKHWMYFRLRMKRKLSS